MKRQGPRGRAKEARVQALKKILLIRAKGRCENPWCRTALPLDMHHVKKRSQGGTETEDGCVLICRPCHEKTDRPDAARLVIEPLGHGRFAWQRLGGERINAV